MDRISHLPEGIIDNILKYLPLRDAVRTSVLSRDWRYNWATLTSLVFDNDFKESLHVDWKPESVIESILQRHKGSILEFTINDIDISSHDVINCWLHILLNHKIEFLKLWFPNSDPQADDHLLSSDLFSFGCLTHLSLQNLKVRLPPSFKGFRNLVNLELFFVGIELEELKAIISGCPMLENLLMLQVRDTQHWILDIDAPNLKIFRFFGNFSSVCFGNANLDEIFIGYHNHELLKQGGVFDNFEFRGSCGSKSNLIKLFSQLTSVTNVQFLGGFLEFLAIGGVPQNLSSNLNCLTYLHFEEIDLGLTNHVSCALCIIRSSPNLQCLHIVLDNVSGEEQSFQYLKEQQNCNVPLSSLETVSISGISGSKSELEFMKLLLLWAIALEKLEVRSAFKIETGDELRDGQHYQKKLQENKLLKELASMRRASSEATIIFE